jgi:hypothetical protein
MTHLGQHHVCHSPDRAESSKRAADSYRIVKEKQPQFDCALPRDAAQKHRMLQRLLSPRHPSET